MPRGTTHRSLICAFAMLALPLLPAAAHAAVQVTVDGNYALPSGNEPVLLLQGMTGDDNVTVGSEPGIVRIQSTSALSDSDGSGTGACNHPDLLQATVITCDLTILADNSWVLLGNDGNDVLEVTNHPANVNVYLFGGAGSDTLTGSPGAERLYGDDADGVVDCITNSCHDVIRDGLGIDQVFGGPGNDTLVQSALAGGPDQDQDSVQLDGGTDTVTYAARATNHAVTVRIGGGGSGTPGEEDDLQDGVERVVGSAGNDTFRTTSSTSGLVLDGAAGNDTFIASPASETFIGGAGVDTVTWADTSFAFAGVTGTANGVADDGASGETDDVRSDIERIIGSSGNDTLLGAAIGGCRVAGGSGADTLTAPATGCILEGGNGADSLNGGSGNDILRPGASGTASSDQVTFGGGTDIADYSAASMVSTDSTIVGVQASANPGATAWCYSLGTGTTSAKKFVGGQAHLDAWTDAPETIVGTVVTDTLCGGPAGTRLEGGAGADVLVGSGGNDLLLGGPGNDLLAGQGGNDVLDGSDGDDNLNGGAGSDIVDGGPGNDPHVRGGGGSDTIRGGTGNDVLDEVAFSAIEQGKPGDELDAADVLDGGPGFDIVDGASGDDVFPCTLDNLADSWSDSGGGETLDCSGLGVAIAYTAGPGIDVLIGTAGNDTLVGAALIDGGAGNDTLVARGSGSTLRGGAGNDALIGSEAADVLEGGDGADSIDARGGNDTIDGGAGGDVISGGSGTEVLSYANRPSGVDVSLDGAANDGTPGEGDNVQADIEEIVGTAHADTLAAGPAGTTLVGGDGNDTLVGSPVGELLQGGPGNDRLLGGVGDDRLDGGPGDDQLLGGMGVDELDGGDGHDVLDGGFGTDVHIGGSGRDTASYATRTRPVIVSLGDRKANDGQRGEKEDIPPDVENVIGGRRNDRLVGNNLGNSLRGGGGNDTLLAGGGNDVLFGGPGNDVLNGGRGNDKHYGEAGNDRVDSRDTTVRDRRLREFVDGGAGVDFILHDARDRILRFERRGIVRRTRVRGRIVMRVVYRRIAPPKRRAVKRVQRVQRA